MSFHCHTTANNNSMNVPVFVVFRHGEDMDDDGSVVSFSTTVSSYSHSDRSCGFTIADGESRWALESCSASVAAAALALQQQRRRSLRGETRPNHPERSISFSSSKLGHGQNNASGTPSRLRSSVPTRGTRPTRLTRMAERAKRTPMARKKSFQRHSLPTGSHSSSAVLRRPIRRKSYSSSRGSRSSPRSLCVDCSCSCSSSVVSPSHKAELQQQPKTLPSTMRPTPRRNSIQCVLPSSSRRDGVLCPTRSTGRGLEAMMVRRQGSMRRSSENLASSMNSNTRRRRATTGCFRIACSSTNTPPRLPQRHPSDKLIPASN